MIADLNQGTNQQHEEELFTVQPSFLAMNMDSFQSYSDKISQALEESSQFTSFLNFDDANSNTYESYSRNNNMQFEELGREIANRIQQQAMILPTDTTSFDLHTIEEDALNEEDISVEKQQFSRKVSCLISAQENEQNKLDNDQRRQDESEYLDASHPQTNLLQDEEHNTTKAVSLLANSNIQSEGIYKDFQNISDKDKQKNLTQMKINILGQQKRSKESSQDSQEQTKVDKYSKTIQTDQAKKENGGENASHAKIQIDEERVLREKVNNHRIKEDLLAQQWEQKDLSLAHFLAIRKQESQTNFRIFDQGKEVNVQQTPKPKQQASLNSTSTQDQQLKQQNARVSYNLVNNYQDSVYQQLNHQPGTTGMLQHQLSPQILSQIKSQSLHIIPPTNTVNYAPGASHNEESSKVLNKSSRNDNQVNLKSQHYFASSHPLNSKTNNNPQLIHDNSQGKRLEAKYLRLQELQKEKLKEEKAKYQKALKDQQDEKIFFKTNRPFHNNFTNQTTSSQISNETNKIGNRINKSSSNEKNEYYLNSLITQQGNNSINNTNSSMNSAQFEDFQGNGYLNSYKMKKKQLSLSNLSSKTVPLSPISKIKQSSGSIYQLPSQVRKIESDYIGSKSPNQKSQQQPLDLNVIKKITQELSSSEQRKNKEKEALEIAKAERQAKILVQSGQVAEAINKMLFQTHSRNQTSMNRQPKQHGAASRQKANNATPVIVVEQHEERQTKQHFQNIDNLFTGHLNESIPQRHQQTPNQRRVMQQLDALRKEQVELGQKIIAKQTRPKSGRPSTTSTQITHSELRDQFQKVQSFTQRTQQKEKNNGLVIQKNGQGQQNSRQNYIQLKTLLL